MKKIALIALVLASFSASAASVDNGRELATKKYACVSCHGEGMNKPIDPSYPKLAGQYADYVAAALKAYQRTGGNLVGRGNAIMAAQAKPLSGKEIADIAAYIGSLQGELVNKR